jgi:hypothetical protein
LNVIYSLILAARQTAPVDPDKIPILGQTPRFQFGEAPAQSSSAILRRAGWNLTTSTIDLSARYVAISAGFVSVVRLADRSQYNLPFAGVGGGLSWQPDKVLKWMGRIFSPKLPHVYEQAFKNLGDKADVFIRFLPKDMLLAYVLKAMSLTSSFFLPSTNIGDVYFFDKIVKKPDLTLADFGGGCIVLAFGAGVIGGGSLTYLLFGGEPQSALEWFIPKGMALTGGANVGLNIGASAQLEAGYISDYQFLSRA